MREIRNEMMENGTRIESEIEEMMVGRIRQGRERDRK